MTLVYQRAVTGAKTHAFVIGCGRFPNLPPEQARAGTVKGAREVARFLLEHRDALVSPLASLEVLLSDPADAVASSAADLGAGPVPADGAVAGFAGKVDAATSVNAEAAGTAWKNRLQPGDVMLFYVSSHGVADSALTAIALFEDVETSGDQAWEQSLNVSYLATGLMTKGAADAWVFFDACQEYVPDVMDLAAPPAGVKLIVFKLRDQIRSRKPLALAASAAGNLAWAPDDGDTPYFTQALLRGLRGACVDAWPQLGWVVTAEKLTYGLGQVAAAAYGNHGLDPQPLVGAQIRAALLTVAQPLIPVALTTDPEAVLQSATVTVTGPGGPLAVPAAANGVLRFEVPPDGAHYAIDATAPGATLSPTSFRAFASAQLAVLK